MDELVDGWMDEDVDACAFMQVCRNGWIDG